MENTTNFSNLAGWLLGSVVLAIGVANLFLVHPVPGGVGILLSLFFFPPMNLLLKRNLGFSFPLVLQLLLFLAILWFTLGISDLGELMGF